MLGRPLSLLSSALRASVHLEFVAFSADLGWPSASLVVGALQCRSVRQVLSEPPRIASAACRLELRAPKGAGHEAVPRDQQWDGPLVHLYTEVSQQFLEAPGLLFAFHHEFDVAREAPP